MLILFDKKDNKNDPKYPLYLGSFLLSFLRNCFSFDLFICFHGEFITYENSWIWYSRIFPYSVSKLQYHIKSKNYFNDMAQASSRATVRSRVHVALSYQIVPIGRAWFETMELMLLQLFWTVIKKNHLTVFINIKPGFFFSIDNHSNANEILIFLKSDFCFLFLCGFFLSNRR